MKKKTLLCGILTFCLFFTACGAKKSTAPMPQSANSASGSTSGNFDMKSPANAPAMPAADSAKAQEAKKAQDENKKIIKNCTLYIVEADLSKLEEAVNKKADELGGYIESENSLEERYTAVVRVPAEKFEDFISYTEKGFSVKNKILGSQNITDAYVDNDARLNNLRAQEEQVLAILKKANTVEEVLKVQAELYKIRGEAEALEAKKKSWDKQVDYATITINADVKRIVVDNKKTIIGGSEFINAIGKGFTKTSVALILFLEKLVIFLISNIFILIILALAGFFGYKKYKKFSKK
jgi:hypothetical protein